MRGIFFLDPADATSGAYGSLGHDVRGDVVAQLISPSDFSLWLVRAELAPGASLAWEGRGDEGIYVVAGEVEVDGRACPAGGAAVVEAGMTVEVRAPAGAQVVHVGAHRPPVGPGGSVHVVGPGGTWASVGEGRDTRYFADSECETCDITLFTTGRSHDYVSAPHSHSADELLHVLDGDIVVGRRRLGPGSTVAVAADRRYGFRSSGFRFLNYRPHVATITRDGETMAEGGRIHGFDAVMDLPVKLVFSTPGDVLIDEALRLEVRRLAPGESTTWPEQHGEEALYVLDGAVDVDGTTVPAGGAVVLHADAPCRLTALEPARLARFADRCAPRGAQDRSRHTDRHLVGPGGWYRSGSPGGSQATWFADSTCDGCDVALFRVERETPGNRGRAHRHSADEILYVVEGTIHFGARAVPAGTAVFIPADTRYAITCGETRHAFLNYRATASIQHYEGDADPLPENGLGRGGELVGDLLD